MAARTKISRSLLLGTTAIAALGLAACANNATDGLAGSAEIGQFGIVVGEPVAVISATRGQGASVDTDQFTVTFNNAEGTSITIGTPEGEEITFDRDDPATWVGYDDDLGTELARLVSEDGDRLEVMIGEVRVPVAPPKEGEASALAAAPVTTNQLAYAVARLDENDTRDGFETYAVTGQLTNVDDLPRYSGLHEETETNDDGVEVCVARCGGDLIQGTAYYNGNFVASVHQNGQILSDAATGGVWVNIDFAEGDVNFNAQGQYRYDDLDDTAPDAVTDVLPVTVDGIVVGVTPVYGPINDPNMDIVTDVTFDEELQIVTPIYSPFNTVSSDDIVTSLNVTFNQQAGINVLQGVDVIRAEHENDDSYSVYLTGSGNGDDIDFNSGVTYTGDLSGKIETPSDDGYYGVDTYNVAGEFGGAVFGPGESAFDVLDTEEGEAMPYPSQIIDATGTAGVFEANSNTEDPLEDNASVEIVGVFGAESDGFDQNCECAK